MRFEEQERFLRDLDFGWYLDALASHRNTLTEEQTARPDADGIQKAKEDYYRCAVRTLAERVQKAPKASRVIIPRTHDRRRKHASYGS